MNRTVFATLISLISLTTPALAHADAYESCHKRCVDLSLERTEQGGTRINGAKRQQCLNRCYVDYGRSRAGAEQGGSNDWSKSGDQESANYWGRQKKPVLEQCLADATARTNTSKEGIKRRGELMTQCYRSSNASASASSSNSTAAHASSSGNATNVGSPSNNSAAHQSCLSAGNPQGEALKARIRYCDKVLPK